MSGLTGSTAPSLSARRQFLKVGAGVVVAGGLLGAGALRYTPANDRQLVFVTLAQALQEAERLCAAAVKALEPATVWTWSQTLEHCAQSIEFSLQGFPVHRSALFQHTLGSAAFHAFAWRGRMRHDLAEPIPGAPELGGPGSVASSVALARLRVAVQRFAAHTGRLHPHFAYGELDHGQYEQAHAMHLANHFSAFDLEV